MGGTEVRSPNTEVTQEFQKLLISHPNGNSFTALLELPPNQAMELLTHTYDYSSSSSLPCNNNNNSDVVKRHRISAFNHGFYSNGALIERAHKGSVKSEEGKVGVDVKSEPLDCFHPDSVDPTVGSECEKVKPLKRKQREKKGKGSSKKSKTTTLEDAEKLPYVHVRARRGQATDSHSLAERVRREKINARMKLLQEIVPGCNKISGTALVLEEIINHVQYLQRQVEYLSMRLAAVSPRIDFNLNSLVLVNENMMECNYPNMALPLPWPEIPLNDRKQFQQQWHTELTRPVCLNEENHLNLVASENSLVRYDSPSNSASLHSSQLKMEL